MLEVEGIHTFYGLSHILFGVSLRVEPGEVICLLGRNGAGKTTTLKSIMGLTPPKQGSIRFKGEEITGKEPYLLARKGIGYVPDDRRIFADLTVGENLEIATRSSEPFDYAQDKTRFVRWDKERVYELFPALKEIESRKGGCLSGGEQKMLAIARALMGNPELLLLDEPTEGLAPMLVRALEEQIRKLRETGLTVLLAEQNVRSALRLGDRGYIIDNGQIRYQGSIEELRENEEVRKKYLLV
jgi:branched-chain amino acid transport system ATP-binding protein